jgi:hypothetical protein
MTAVVSFFLTLVARCWSYFLHCRWGKEELKVKKLMLHIYCDWLAKWKWR